ncbi:hypothetical protein [Psychroserpens sp. Hel_I_66]|uniref:hypothetical protein n=1 Tax=Psychroserpens sp. Hel_I_66 TaxID=1250004 RepID=UPI000647E2E5|nr:hypothetical protein [Psychroserpens sp. Hel_I_66]
MTFALFALSCKEAVKEQNTFETEQKVQQKQTQNKNHDSVIKDEKAEAPKHYVHLYVTAHLGLHYRDSPKGTILGKFDLNTPLKIIDYTKIPDQVRDGEKTIKGEWVGVEKGIDTVYVFNGFLSDVYVQSDLKLYNATSFLNVSETYFNNAYSEDANQDPNLILTESNLENNLITLNKSQRKKFLEKLKLSESDHVFIYTMKTDEVKTLTIKDLPAIASMNAYGPAEDHQNVEYDYYFGFDLGEGISNWENLVYIGNENPFQTGELKPMVWKAIDNDQFPIKTEKENPKIKANTYKFSTKEQDFYLKKSNQNMDSYHIVIIDKNSKQELLNQYYNDTEGTYLTGLTTEGQDNNQDSQSHWTGKLFKNKPPIIFDFLGYSFGCPSLTVLDKTEPPIQILCDNRH